MDMGPDGLALFADPANVVQPTENRLEKEECKDDSAE
jgi:hypothetical protein